jgi:hypothetical protein
MTTIDIAAWALGDERAAAAERVRVSVASYMERDSGVSPGARFVTFGRHGEPVFRVKAGSRPITEAAR